MAVPVISLDAALDPANTGGQPVQVVSSSIAYCEKALDSDHGALSEFVLMAAAAAGITVVASAGDYGSAGCYPPEQSVQVQYPAGSPHVTAVGGTHILDHSPAAANCAPPFPVCSAPGTCAWAPVGGTSASAPLLASGLALVDQGLHRAGRPALGFLNPRLYALATAPTVTGVVNDVTRGTNSLFGNNCCTAAPGYDAASGWGSLNLDGLLQHSR